MRVPWQRGAEQSCTQDDHLWGGIFDLRHHRWWLWASSWPNWAALRAIIFDEVNIFSSPDQQYLVNFVLRHVKFFISNLCSIGPIHSSEQGCDDDHDDDNDDNASSGWGYRSWWWDKENDDNTSQDEEQRQKLNRITHPEIYKEMIWEAVRCFSWILLLSIAFVGNFFFQLN